MPYLTKQVRFSAAHYYWRPEWSPEENISMFRACANREGHGHNYVVDVCVQGKVHPKTGMIINYFDLDPLLHRYIVDVLDHKNLNTQVDYFSDHVPTLENIACFIWMQLFPQMVSRNLLLSRIKVSENHDLYVEYDGVLS